MPDAGVTQFTVVQPAGPHTTSVADMSADAQEVGALRRFQDIMLDIRRWLPNEVVGDDVPYDYDRLSTLSTPANGDRTCPTHTGDGRRLAAGRAAGDLRARWSTRDAAGAAAR